MRQKGTPTRLLLITLWISTFRAPVIMGILLSIPQIRAKGSRETTDLESTADQDEYALYDYDGGTGTGGWGGLCSTGLHQSPVNFGKVDGTYGKRKLQFQGASQRPIFTNYTNSGQTVKIKLVTPEPIRMFGGPLGNDTYEFQQLHFHWGGKRNVGPGSEHTIASKRFLLESHFVFYKQGAKNPTEVENGIAVLGVLHKRSFRENSALKETISSVRDVIKAHSFILKDGGMTFLSFLPRNLRTYYSYVGSLTTPPCTEGVNWVVFSEQLTISKRQVAQFKRIKDDLGHNVLHNFRETQPLNGRRLKKVDDSKVIYGL